MLGTRQKTGTRSIYSRMIRLVVPIIMGTSLIIGLIVLIGIRRIAQDSLTESHHAQITSLVHDVDDAIEQRVSDLNGLAQERDARNFARATLVNTASADIESAQTRLLGDFTNLLEQHPNYLALRYVTYNGSVW